jgi:hypothetical protein
MLRNDRTAGKRAMEARQGIDIIDSRIPAGPLSRRIHVTAVR